MKIGRPTSKQFLEDYHRSSGILLPIVGVTKSSGRFLGTAPAGHQAEEIFTLGKQDIDALSASLDNKRYFLGNQPTTLDASAFGLLINIIGCPIESPLKEYGLSKNNLINYVDRLKHEFYPDLQIPVSGTS